VGDDVIESDGGCLVDAAEAGGPEGEDDGEARLCQHKDQDRQPLVPQPPCSQPSSSASSSSATARNHEPSPLLPLTAAIPGAQRQAADKHMPYVCHILRDRLLPLLLLSTRYRHRSTRIWRRATPRRVRMALAGALTEPQAPMLDRTGGCGWSPAQITLDSVRLLQDYLVSPLAWGLLSLKRAWPDPWHHPRRLRR
jgi:hypothetical protein